MKLQAFIVNWENVYKNVSQLERQFTQTGYAPTIINSWEFGKKDWVFVGDIRYYRQFYKALSLFDFDNDYFLFCAGDISYNKWSEFFIKFEQVSEELNVGAYAPYYTNSPWNFPETYLSTVSTIPKVAVSSQTDGIFIILHKDLAKVMLDFFIYFEQKVNLVEFTSGWGLDYIWSALSMHMGKYILRDLDATVTHPTGSSYDHGKATFEMGQILSHFSTFAAEVGYTEIDSFYTKIAERMSNVEISKDPDYFYKGIQLHIKSPRKLPYYIISIGEERASAVQSIHQQISSSFNISLSGVNGYDKKSSDKFFKQFPTVRNELTRPGEFGCFASHYAFWKYVADKNLEGAVVFEDDALVHDSFIYMYKLALRAVPNTYDVFSMYVDKDQYGRYNTGEFVNETVAKGYQDWSTLCYFISSKGAKKLIQLVDESGMNQPVDWFLFRHGHSGKLDVYTWPPAINPPVSINKELVPQIKR